MRIIVGVITAKAPGNSSECLAIASAIIVALLELGIPANLTKITPDATRPKETLTLQNPYPLLTTTRLPC